MPNGVICGGAVDGSNQLGAMVTCHAITARPDGAGAPAVAGLAPRATAATSSEGVNAGRRRRAWDVVMSTLRAALVVRLERCAEHGLRLRRRQPRPSRRTCGGCQQELACSRIYPRFIKEGGASRPKQRRATYR